MVAGVAQDHAGRPNDTAAPRSALGFSRDGHRLHLLTVDGRQRDSGGLTLTALGRFLRELGARDALNLDGGGSTTLLAGRSGSTALEPENSPSDGRPRTVANGLVLTAAGTGRPTGYRLAAVSPRVFPYLSRTVTAVAHDASLGSATAPGGAPPRWSTEPGGVGRIGRIGPIGGHERDDGAVFRALRPGRVRVHARGGGVQGSLRLEVLGPAVRLVPSAARLGTTGPGDPVPFDLLGLDAEGRAAPVEARDVRWTYDRRHWRVTAAPGGGFTLQARVPFATGLVKATVPAVGLTAELAVGAGLSPLLLTDLTDAAAWTGSGTGVGPGPKPTAGPAPPLAACSRRPAATPGPRGAPVRPMSKKSPFTAATTRRPGSAGCRAAASATVPGPRRYSARTPGASRSTTTSSNRSHRSASSRSYDSSRTPGARARPVRPNSTPSPAHAAPPPDTTSRTPTTRESTTRTERRVTTPAASTATPAA
ncbi:phosphodiester glycosidase family protein, partial [Streptomyces sp. WAC06614]|uniref:phosphodiester glycosidase family protein n=1 Tax=Streptomyces sp. WAC06614 TaxID=2487416 RepID=UPI0021AF0153